MFTIILIKIQKITPVCNYGYQCAPYFYIFAFVWTQCLYQILEIMHYAAVSMFCLQLFSDVVPKTCENFKSLITGDKGKSPDTDYDYSYKQSLFHRIVPNGWIQGGGNWPALAINKRQELWEFCWHVDGHKTAHFLYASSRVQLIKEVSIAIWSLFRDQITSK